MVEEILIGSMVVATGTNYLVGYRTGRDEEKKYNVFPALAAIGVNWLSMLSLIFGISVKQVENWAEEMGKLLKHEPAAIIPLLACLGLVAIGTMVAVTFAPPLLYEKGLNDGVNAKKREEKNEI